MEIKVKKPIERLEREITLKSVERSMHRLY